MARVPPTKGGHLCLTCDALDTLKGDDRDALVEWLKDKSINNRMIFEACSGYGLKITRSSIARHRREHSVE